MHAIDLLQSKKIFNTTLTNYHAIVRSKLKQMLQKSLRNKFKSEF